MQTLEHARRLTRSTVSGDRSAVIGTRELAESQLRRSSYFALANVTCDYRRGVLILRGCLPTYYLKQLAQTMVAEVEGVEVIDNRIQVADVSAQTPMGA